MSHIAISGTVASLALLSGHPALAQAASKQAAQDGSGEKAEIVVIGTRRTDRSVTTSASPVDVISSAEIATRPSSNLLDSIKSIVPSFFVGQNTISDASSLVRAPSLRGLPGDEVLVMLNGKRYNRSALVQVYNGGDTGLSFGSQGPDMGAIPSIAIKNLEVLRDGATAQYGSDAIAGVLNYGLRDNAGLELVGRYGQYYQNGDGKSYDIAGDFGVKLGDRGFANLAAEYDHEGQTSRGATRPIAVAFAQQFPNLASQLPNYPLPAQIWGSSPDHGYKFLFNSAYDVTDNSKLYFFGNVAYNHVDESFNFRSSYPGSTTFQAFDGTNTFNTNIGGRSFFQHPYYLTQCPAGNATCPAGGYVQDNNVFLLSSIYPAGFTPRFVGVSREAYGVLGYKGKVGDLTWDLSASLSRNSLALSMYDSISPSYGQASQTSFKFGNTIQKEFDVNLDLTYALNAGLASPVTLSWGGEFRRETYEATAGDPQSYGSGPYATAHELFVQTSPGVFTDTGTKTVAESPAASGYGGTSPAFAGSHTDQSYALYAGAETDIVKAWTVGAMGRYEHYDSSGGAGVFKVNTIYHFSDAIAVRGTVGTGFHAPSPGQNNVAVLTTNFIAGQSLQTGTFPVTSAIAKYFGAVPLKPEKSTNFGAGVVLKPVHNFTLTVDWYEIRVRDRIFISKSFFPTAADIAALPDLASVGVGGQVQYFTNAFKTTTNGVDVVASYRTGLLDGRLGLTLAYNYNKSTSPVYDSRVISYDQIIDVSYLAPNHRATLSGNWSRGPWTVNARENYYGSWVDANDYPTARFPANTTATDPLGNSLAGQISAGQRFGAKFTTDLDVSYTWRDHYTLTVGGNNLFNTFPDKIKATPSNPIYTLTNSTADGQIYPRSGGPFGINGGFWYVQMRVKY